MEYQLIDLASRSRQAPFMESFMKDDSFMIK